MSPVVTLLPDSPGQSMRSIGMYRYRLTGGDIAQDWADTLRPPEAPWCELTVWDSGGMPGDVLGSYGGSVWPAAWPELFLVGPRSTHGQNTRITAEGLALLAAAREDGAS